MYFRWRRRTIPSQEEPVIATTKGMPNVGRALKMLGRSTPTLARQAGVAQSYLYDLISGTAQSPSRTTEEAIAQALGLPRHVMINDELTELELRTTLSRSALVRVGPRLRHSPALMVRLLDSPSAPVTDDAWLALDAQLEALGVEADLNTERSPGRSRSKG
jgi:lambda repressor-like predicted transcriptional regulator